MYGQGFSDEVSAIACPELVYELIEIVEIWLGQAEGEELGDLVHDWGLLGSCRETRSVLRFPRAEQGGQLIHVLLDRSHDHVAS